MKARIPPRSLVLCTKCSTSNVDFETYICSMPKRVSILSTCWSNSRERTSSKKYTGWQTQTISTYINQWYEQFVGAADCRCAQVIHGDPLPKSATIALVARTGASCRRVPIIWRSSRQALHTWCIVMPCFSFTHITLTVHRGPGPHLKVKACLWGKILSEENAPLLAFQQLKALFLDCFKRLSGKVQSIRRIFQHLSDPEKQYIQKASGAKPSNQILADFTKFRGGSHYHRKNEVLSVL